MRYARPVKPADSVLITGCSSGIGEYTAWALHQMGYDVIASCRSEEDVARLESEGLKCVRIDLNDEASIDSGFQAAIERSETADCVQCSITAPSVCPVLWKI